jgi:hypothetical protein
MGSTAADIAGFKNEGLGAGTLTSTGEHDSPVLVRKHQDF